MEPEGRVLPLISQAPSETDTFIINEHTLAHLRAFAGPFAFLAVCGDYRSGKSCLLNWLFLEGRGFATSPLPSACTRGINLWSNPVLVNGVNLWIVDTEGFGSLEKDSSHDGRIFLMSLLLSNMVLYNSVGAIDENAIQKLSMICRQAKLLDESIPQTKLFWVLRDFSLKMVDKHGIELSPDEYLEQCLKQGKQRNEKEFLRGLFQQRHCFPLIRPVIDENKLGNLQETDKSQLRQQFQSSIKQLGECLMKTVSPKSINGVPIGNHNFDILLKNLVSTVNQGTIDSNLETTYEKIKQFEQSLRKQQITSVIQGKIESVRKLFPVQKQHFDYLRQQTSEIVAKQLHKMEEYSQGKDLEVIRLQLTIWIEKRMVEAQQQNRDAIGKQIKDYLYRQLVDSYPKLILLSSSQFQSKYLQFLHKLREDYHNKYKGYFTEQSSINLYFNQFLEKQEKKLFFELAKRWKLAQRELQDRIQDLKKSKKSIEEQCKRVKQEKQRLLKSLQQNKREQSKALQQIKLQIEETFKQQARTIAKQYDRKLQQSTSAFTHELSYLKQSLQAALNSNSQLKTQFQYEKQSLLQKLAVQRQKSDLISLKQEQARNHQQMQHEQTKNQLQNRLRISELKVTDLQNTLSNQRRKFQLISEERRAEEVKIMQELSEKNERIDNLTQQLFQLQERYKRELDRILTQEKDILCKTLSAKMSEYDLRCRNYEAKLHQLQSSSSERDFFQQKCEQIELESRELRAKLEQQEDKVSLLSSRIRKLESQVQDKEALLAQLKTQQERELAMMNENVEINRRFLKQAEERQSQQNQWLKNRSESLLRESTQTAARKLEQSLDMLRGQLELRFDKERDQLKEIIKNNYDQIQNLRIDSVTVRSQLQKINQILHNTVRSSVRKGSVDRDYQLAEIVQSPEQNSETGKQQSHHKERGFALKNTEYLAEEVEELVISLREELNHLLKERGNAREQLRNTSEQLQTYQKALVKFKQENKGLKLEQQQLKKKISALQSSLSELGLIRERCNSYERQNEQLKRQFDLKDQFFTSREENYRENIAIYKETVATLTEENKRLASALRQLSQSYQQSQNELQRFKIWASEVKLKQADSPASPPLSSDRIKEMQAEIKRLARRLQDEKLQKLQRQTRKQINLHSDILAENRNNELQSLRRENSFLIAKLQQMRDIQLRLVQQKRSSKTRQLELEEQRTLGAREELESYKKKSKQAILSLQHKLQISIEENKGLRQQLLSIEQSISHKQSFAYQLLEQEAAELKREKQRLLDFHNQRVAELQANLNSKGLQAQRRGAQAEQRLQEYRESLSQEHNRIILEGERHRLKYEHLLKVNGQLIKQIETLKSKAHQLTIREKYKSKISSLFDD